MTYAKCLQQKSLKTTLNFCDAPHNLAAVLYINYVDHAAIINF